MRKVTMKRIGVAGAVLATGIAGAAAVLAATNWGPSRPTFTWASPATYVTFNSITDNPSYGDERQLLEARDLNSPTTDYAKTTTVTDGEDVVLEVYFHNDAASNLALVANNTKVKFDLPTTSATTLSPTAYISADNANPGQVWASADLTSSQPFTISYEPGSAKLYTNYVNGIQISDAVANGGTLIGSNGPDGKVPGCAQNSGYVTIRVKVHMTPQQQPVYSCDALHVTSEGNRAYNYSVDATAKNGATITGYSFDFGDGNVVDSANNTASHTYVKDGTYTATATVKFNVGDSQKTVNCSQTITVSTPPVTPPTTPTPTPKAKSLPNTGPGDVLGIFTGASSLGAVSHYVVNRRRKH
ncbi:MAG TPA: PKD domain-containing protein [Candidatus Saccharimonadales bacterium]|nr:PKD domain-containing protein [Candidatus Saccharimonadales bacterium]